MERLKASLEKGQLLCGLGSGALCVACFWVALFASNIRKGHAYAIFVTKSSADALVHSPMRSNYDCFVCTNCKYTGCDSVLECIINAQRAAGALRTRCGRARAFTNAINLKYDCFFIHTTGCVLHSLV